MLIFYHVSLFHNAIPLQAEFLTIDFIDKGGVVKIR